MTERRQTEGPFDRRLVREIGIILLLKVVALVAIKLMFFSDPAADHLDAGQVGNALFGQPDTETSESL